MIPCLQVTGNSISETWDEALFALWREGMTIRTQYDHDPNTGIWQPPSIDCSMRMIVKQSVSEPRLHICLEGGPEQLGDYETEVVDGLKDDWVKRSPDARDKRWTYTYHGRLAAYGSRMNFASALPEDWSRSGEWTGLAYSRPAFSWGIGVDGEAHGYKEHQDHEEIEPFDQIEFIVQQLAKTPYTRRAVAMTGFPPADAKTDDPPCLRQIWCRGYHEDGVLKIDMHTHWRSRDAWGAALFNMHALTELHRKICYMVQDEMDETTSDKCPACGGNLKDVWVVPIGITALPGFLPPHGSSVAYKRCEICDLNPFLVVPGAYVDESDSFHVYGRDMRDFEQRFIRGVRGIDPESREEASPRMDDDRRFIDLSTEPWSSMLEDGRSKAFERSRRDGAR